MLVSRKIGSVLIIAGTAIGAGMLALPIVTIELGFIGSVIAMILLAGCMFCTSYLVLHVNMAFPEGSNLTTMSKGTIGSAGYAITWVTCLLLLYSLTAAYTSGGSALVAETIEQYLHVTVSPYLSALLFIIFLGAIVYFETRSVDYATRILMTFKIGAFVLMVVFLSPHVMLEKLTHSPQSAKAFFIALPILITAFGFHVVIPNLRDYLHSDAKKLRWVLIVGMVVLFVVYTLWQWVVLGNISSLTVHSTVSEMIDDLSSQTKSSLLGVAVNFFADLGMVTSFLGVSLSLLHFIGDGLKLTHKTIRDRFWVFFLTFFPPLCFTWIYPEGFVMALSYAGLFVVVLHVFLPIWMASAMHRKGMVSAFPIRLPFLLQLGCVLIGFAIVFSQILYH